ncbi:hypothetical protein CEXT_717411 [Caerostris extrusa]|uniref:Uncharacterized protein n=1 Tax=Caerostris extrusa TaxID=172846 RepID=A0AAV4RKI6_CAEEX|nr:hypothetical protein CEXT_717411 [Caerostris extrusa]
MFHSLLFNRTEYDFISVFHILIVWFHGIARFFITRHKILKKKSDINLLNDPRDHPSVTSVCGFLTPVSHGVVPIPPQMKKPPSKPLCSALEQGRDTIAPMEGSPQTRPSVPPTDPIIRAEPSDVLRQTVLKVIKFSGSDAH